MSKLVLFLFFMCFTINLKSVDYADILTILLASVLLIKNPISIFLENLDNYIKILGFLFLSSFAISVFVGYDLRFIVFLLFNTSLFFIFYNIIYLENSKTAFLYWLSVFFIIGNVVFLIAGNFDITLSTDFDIYRNGRFLGTFGDPNFTGFAAVIAFIYFLDKIFENTGSAQERYWSIIWTISSVALLIISESRAAWGAGLISTLAYFAVMSGRRHKLVIPSLFAIIAVFLTLNVGQQMGNAQIGAIADRVQSFTNQTDSAEAERFQFVYTRAAIAVGMDHPLGVGPGMTSSYTGIVSVDGLAIGSHNSFVQIFTEFGWLAFLSTLLILAITLWRIVPMALAGWMLNDVSCRVIFALMMGQIVFAMAHDMIAWRIAWVVPALSICAAFARQKPVVQDVELIRKSVPILPKTRPSALADIRDAHI